MTILGIDPGTALTGYAALKLNNGLDELPLLHEVSCVKTHKDTPMHIRLKVLFDEMTEVFSRVKPDVLVIERLFFNTNVKTAMSVGQARGVYLLVAACFNVHVFEYTALEAKQVLTGYGRASKKEVQEAVKEYFSLDSIVKPDDANDAIAMALCFLRKDYANLQN